MPEPAAVATVPFVDLPRFMGDWYVIANIPTFLETESYAATESYRQEQDGTITTIFSQRKGSFEAPLKRYNQRAFVRDNSGNANWGMQFIWPIRAEYLIAHVDEDYSQAIIARTRRDYVWILARSAQLAESEFAALSERVRQLGYDMSKLRRVPQAAATPGT
jgi:apolipoprotein D and lipocalin family protein